MIPLNTENLATVHNVCTLHKKHPDVLSTFEIGVLFDLVERSGRMGDEAAATDAEWGIVGDACLALTAADQEALAL